jgi:hypothetical protein
MKAKLKGYYDKNPILVILILVTMMAPIVYVGASYTMAATGHELYNEITTDLKLYDYELDPGVGEVYTLLEDENSRVYTTLVVTVDVSHTDGLKNIWLYICKNIDGGWGDAMMSVQMEMDSPNTYKSTVDVDGWPTNHYWAKISPAVTVHEVSYINPDYVEYWDWWNSLSLWEQEVLIESWGNAQHPDAPVELIKEWKDDVYVVVDGPQKFYVKNPNQDMTFTIGIIQADGTELGGGGTSNQPLTFFCDITVGTAAQVELSIYTEAHSLVVRFSDIDAAAFNVGSAQENGNYYAEVTVYGADGWNGDVKTVPFTIGNPESIVGTVTIYRATDSGWVVVHDGDPIGGDLKIEVVLDKGDADTMTAVFDGPGEVYRFPMSYDSMADKWTVILNTREMYNDYYTVYVEVVNEQDGSVSNLSAFAFDAKGGAEMFPIVPVLLIVGVLGMATLGVYWRTGGFGGTKSKKKSG